MHRSDWLIYFFVQPGPECSTICEGYAAAEKWCDKTMIYRFSNIIKKTL
jgi:hypothetical protein